MNPDTMQSHLPKSAWTTYLTAKLTKLPANSPPPNGTTADPTKMQDAMLERVQRPQPRVIPVDKLTDEDVEIPGPLFHTHQHHAIFAGHTQFTVNDINDNNKPKQMTITNLKYIYNTKIQIMNHLKRIGQYESVTHASYFVVGATDVDDAISSVKKYASNHPKTFFTQIGDTYRSYRYRPYGGRKHTCKHKGKGKGKGKSQKRKVFKKTI
jgi:hypothetical protein